MAKKDSVAHDGNRRQAIVKGAKNARDRARDKSRTRSRVDTSGMSPSEARQYRRTMAERLSRRVRIIFIAAIALAVAGVATGTYFFLNRPAPAMVGNLKITEAELRYHMDRSRFQFEQLQAQYPEYTFTDEELRQNALDSAVEMEIFTDQAKKMGITLNDAEKAEKEQLINETIPASATLQQMDTDEYVKMVQGCSYSDFKRHYDESILYEKVFAKLREDAQVTDEEAKTAYDAAPETYETATVRHILFLFEGLDTTNPRTQEQSKALADDTLRRINEGESIATLASSNLNEDTASISTGGLYQFTRNDSYEQAFKDWAFSTPNVGDTGIVETSYGYHVMQLESRDSSFDTAKENVIATLKADKAEAVHQSWHADPMYTEYVNNKVFDKIS